MTRNCKILVAGVTRYVIKRGANRSFFRMTNSYPCTMSERANDNSGSFFWFSAIGLLMCILTPAHAGCEKLPSEVTTYLASAPGWSVVRIETLANYYRTVWNEDHSGECPGIVRFSPDDTGSPYYAVTLTKVEGHKVYQQLVAISAHSRRGMVLAPPMNVKTTNVPAISVIWRMKPGKYKDAISGKEAIIPHDSVVYERIEAGALVYFMVDGKFHELQLYQ